MKDKLNKYIIFENSSILDALKKIDSNKKGFLIVINSDGTVVGTLTDGDIRRSFIKGSSVDSNIPGIYAEKFSFLNRIDGLSKATQYFKEKPIKFLPIVDDQMKLVNIITKNQMHALLLQDIHADLDYDFLNLDEEIIDHEIFPRPWGFYKTTVMNDYFQSKIISVNPKAQISLQSHNYREEHWIVAHGTGVVQLEKSNIEVQSGNSIFIPKGCRHRLINTNDRESLIITEVQLGSYFGEDDIVRYEDLYGRT